MQPIKPRGSNRTYKKPANWDEAKDGVCGDLHVRIDLFGTTPLCQITSSYKPSTAELAQLNAGGVIEVSLLCNVQPPIGLSVVEAEADESVGSHDEHGPAQP